MQLLKLVLVNFRIDLGVIDPDAPGDYSAIERDGATYHSSPSARDRDRIRAPILENLAGKSYVFGQLIILLTVMM